MTKWKKLCRALILALIGLKTFVLLAEDKASAPAMVMETVSFRGSVSNLTAYLFRPQGDGPFPAVIWNHGGKVSLEEAGPVSRFDAIAGFFTRNGYVLFIPDRGVRTMQFDNQPLEPEELSVIKQSALEGFGISHNDLEASMNWLRKKPYVDEKRFAMIGYSAGAVQGIYEAAKSPSIRACVAFTPNALIWTRSHIFRDIITDSVQQAKVPIFLIQAQNDLNLEVSVALGQVLADKGKPSRTMVYPPHGKSQKDANLFALTGSETWGKDVLKFLDAAMGQNEAKILAPQKK